MLNTEEIDEISRTDPECEDIRNCLKSGRWQDMEYKQYLPMRTELCALENLILRGTRILIPTALRERVLQLRHEGHPGIVLMKQRLRSKVWWPQMDKDIEKYCTSCYGCQLVSQPEKT